MSCNWVSVNCAKRNKGHLHHLGCWGSGSWGIDSWRVGGITEAQIDAQEGEAHEKRKYYTRCRWPAKDVCSISNSKSK